MVHNPPQDTLLTYLKQWVRAKENGPRIEERKLELKLVDLVKSIDPVHSSQSR